MKTTSILLACAVVFLPSCEKVRDLAGKRLASKRTPGTAAEGNSVAGEASEIPAEVRSLLTAAPRRIVIVDYYADWCGPCRMLSPILEKVAAAHAEHVEVCKINTDSHRALATAQGVRAIPDVRIYADGKKVDAFVGALPESELERRIAALVEKLPSSAAAPEAAAPAAKPAGQAIQPMKKGWLPAGVERR